MAMSLQLECRYCPLKQECFQWTLYDKDKCKVYHARNVTAKQVWFGDEN